MALANKIQQAPAGPSNLQGSSESPTERNGSLARPRESPGSSPAALSVRPPAQVSAPENGHGHWARYRQVDAS
ncbi:hypothetical protein E4U58_003805 [Claviceps cyperi]|nr:hypothetical protein E4U58_003805 [Claviceps cyperi]